MRRISSLLSAVLVGLVATSSLTHAQTRDSFVQGFGGLRLSSVSGHPATFGGAVAIGLTPNIQAVGEVGRVGNVLPSTLDSLIAFTPVEFRISAFYGGGGVRFVTNPHARVKGYVETTAGIAQLRSSLTGLGLGNDALVSSALRLLDRTEPMAGVGGGIIIQGGALVADIGYRYTRIFTDDPIQRLLSGGKFDVSQVRAGIGVRF